MIINRIESVPKSADLSNDKYLRTKQTILLKLASCAHGFTGSCFCVTVPVPIVTEVLDPDGDLLSGYTDRPTVKEYVVDFLLKELSECESGLLTYQDAWNATLQVALGSQWHGHLLHAHRVYMPVPDIVLRVE